MPKTQLPGSQIKDASLGNADLAAGAGIDISKINGLQAALDAKVEASALAMVALPVTIADCENTDVETNIVQITIPANSWLDGEMIEVYFRTESLQNYGSNRNLTHKIYFGSVNVSATLLVGSGTSVGQAIRSFKAIRHGTSIYINGRGGTDQFYTTYSAFNTDWLNTGNGGAILTNCDFTIEQVLKITNQWQTAHANMYVRVYDPLVIKTRRAA